MLKNYFKIIWRNMQRHKAFSFVNLAGLTLSLTAVILIALYIRYELSFDRYLPTADRLYRVYADDTRSNTGEKTLLLPMGLGRMLKSEFPEVDDFLEANGISDDEYAYDEKRIKLKTLDAGKQFFHLFPFHFIMGNPATALAEKNSVVITRSAAVKLFGHDDPLNKVLTTGNGSQFSIAGVIEDIPSNTHFNAEVISVLGLSRPFSWHGEYIVSDYHYLLLKSPADAARLEAGFSSLYKKYGFPTNISIHLQPVKDIHLYSHADAEIGANSDIRYVYIFLCIAVVLLLIACVNYINLSTARSMHRAREVGVRKVLGAVRHDLIRQFLGETFFLFALSACAAMILARLLYPLFNRYFNTDVIHFDRHDGGIFLLLLLIIAVFAFLAGLYPAFYLSKQKTMTVIKGLPVSESGNVSFLRKGLVVFQFFISAFLIVATATIYDQLNYISHKDLGFDKEQLVMLPGNYYDKKYDAFRTSLESYSGIKAVTSASWRVGERLGSNSKMEDKKDTSKKSIEISFVDANVNFIPTMGIRIREGRSFSHEFASDTLDAYSTGRPIILNETAVKVLGLKDPVGQVLNEPGLQGTVIGVAEDFNGLSLHKAVTPVVLRSGNDRQNFLNTYVRIRPYQVSNTLRYIEKEWKKFYPERMFDYSFVDNRLQQLYLPEKRLGALFAILSLLAILISCMGLFGLVLFLCEKRVREIGIRKVLGASVKQIVMMLSADFFKPIIIGMLIAFPLAWWAMSTWLEDFAYRVRPGWELFALSGACVLVLAALTIGFHALKSATANPVAALRSE